MMYGLSVFPDGTIELFNMKNSMVEFIIEDFNLNNANSNVEKSDKMISIHTDNYKTTYFYDKEDRKNEVLIWL